MEEVRTLEQAEAELAEAKKQLDEANKKLAEKKSFDESIKELKEHNDKQNAELKKQHAEEISEYKNVIKQLMKGEAPTPELSIADKINLKRKLQHSIYKKEGD